MHGGSNMAQDSAPEPTPAVNVRHDDFVAQVNPDPTAARGGTVLAGFIGKGAAAGDLRVYGDHSLTSWVDVPADAVLHAVELPAASSPLGGSVLWVKSDAKLTPSGSAAPELPIPPSMHNPCPTASFHTCPAGCGPTVFSPCPTESITCPPGCHTASCTPMCDVPTKLGNCTHPPMCGVTGATRLDICSVAAICIPTNGTVAVLGPHPTAACPQPTPTAIPTQNPACHTPATVCTQVGCMHPTATAVPTNFGCQTAAALCTQAGCITQQPGCEQTGFVGHCGLTLQPGQACRQGTFNPFGGNG